MLNKPLTLILFLVAATFLVQSCRQGCTDPKAFNYEAKAQENDGTCLYCDSAYTGESEMYVNVIDQNYQSPYYYSNVLQIINRSQGITFEGNGCGALGHTGESCTTFTNDVKVVNLTNSTLFLTGTFYVTYFQSSLTYSFNATEIPANDTLRLGNIGSVCDPSAFPFPNLFLEYGYTIDY